MQLELFPSATIDMQSAAFQRRGYCLQLPVVGDMPHHRSPQGSTLFIRSEGRRDRGPTVCVVGCLAPGLGDLGLAVTFSEVSGWSVVWYLPSSGVISSGGKVRCWIDFFGVFSESK